ncbi:hypothetical protein KAR91_54885 [Candidatus Pacearchaeota archaeon]|nr:hypothetical protein [Candidatus Pacearchaeota archaeon]
MSQDEKIAILERECEQLRDMVDECEQLRKIIGECYSLPQFPGVIFPRKDDARAAQNLWDNCTSAEAERDNLRIRLASIEQCNLCKLRGHSKDPHDIVFRVCREHKEYSRWTWYG